MESYSFAAPVAYLLELLMLWTDQSRIVTFGIAGVLGMIAGSAAYALRRRARSAGRASARSRTSPTTSSAAILMGFGGVTALGCTIGQGLTGISTLALGSILDVRARSSPGAWPRCATRCGGSSGWRRARRQPPRRVR